MIAFVSESTRLVFIKNNYVYDFLFSLFQTVIDIYDELSAWRGTKVDEKYKVDKESQKLVPKVKIEYTGMPDSDKVDVH